VIVGWRKRFGAATVLAAIAGTVLALSAWAGMAVVSHTERAIGAAPQFAAPPVIAAVKRPAPAYTTAVAVPVLVYHEMNNGCAPSAPVCEAKDPETVSTAQLTAELAYLLKAGYRTISLAQYEAWLRDPSTLLPARPILLTADNGIRNFLQGAQPVLERDGFTATAFLVSGFADGAAGQCQQDLAVPGRRYDVQPGCGPANKDWDLTWPQLRTLNPRAWSFALEAGPSGHFVQDYDPHCRMFDACKVPGETTAAYEARVRRELTTGLRALAANLPGRVNRDAWVVPYSDLGYHRCAQADCTPQNSTGPAGWLARYAQSRFGAVFVEDAFRNAVQHERFRMDINGSYSETYFQHLLAAFTAAGDFDRTRARVVPPPIPTASADPAVAEPLATSAPATVAASTPACHPLSDEGACYEPGEFCRASDQGVTGLAGDGKTIICEENDGLRWEPVTPKASLPPTPAPRQTGPPHTPSPSPPSSPSPSPSGSGS
jgi:hypothetical protein